MQTFLPLPSFTESARVLDRQRLGKQRVECMQIVTALTEGGDWANHPAVLMWQGHVPALCEYGAAICGEWVSRGYKDTCRLFFAPLRSVDPVMPWWFGRPEFHASHRGRLLMKDPAWYGQFNWTEGPCEYWWPTKHERAQRYLLGLESKGALRGD